MTSVKKWDFVIWYDCADVNTGGVYSQVLEVKPDGSLRLKLNYSDGRVKEQQYSTKHVEDPYLQMNERARKRDGGWDTIENDQLRDQLNREQKVELARRLEADSKLTTKVEEVKLESLEPEVLALVADRFPIPTIVTNLRKKYAAHPSLTAKIHDDWAQAVVDKAQQQAQQQEKFNRAKKEKVPA